MKTLKVDETGDLVLENGSFVWIEGDEELAQSIRIILQTAKGEWFLDEGLGVDRQGVFTKIFNENTARDSIIEALSVEPRVQAVEDLTFYQEGRQLHIKLNIRKQDQEILEVTEVMIIA